ncbi:MAG: TetR/AcrR family transcriptional regulator [Acidobacteriota bacterium]|nr:TetR/AcrR family transcriptional regulator [Acidobacteriota bacterium]
MLKRSVGRPRDGNPAETRRGILRAAEESFATAGFVGATTRQVAARAGVNVATLHYHFGNKEKLYRAVLAAAAGADFTVPGGGGAPAERLATVVEALWDFGVAHPSLPRLSLLHRLAGPTAPAEAPPDTRVALLTSTLAETGAKPPYPPGDAARVILAFLDSALVASQDGSDFETGSPAPASASASRSGVVAAALRVSGLA